MSLAPLVLLAQTSQYSKLVFIKPYTANNARTAYIEVNTTVVALRGMSYYEMTVEPGKYTIVLNSNKGLSFDVVAKENETLYFEYKYVAGVFSGSEALVPVPDTNDAKQLMRGLYPLTVEESKPKSFKNRFSLAVALGIGYQLTDMVTLDSGENSGISTGGGIGLGFIYGRRVSQHVELLFSYINQMDMLYPAVSNANIDFIRHVISFTPTYIIPLNKIGTSTWTFGAGLDVYLNPRMEVNLLRIANGFKDTWTYNNTWGYHFHTAYQLKLNQTSIAEIGARFHFAQYTFDQYIETPPPNIGGLTRPNANGINFFLKYSWLF